MSIYITLHAEPLLLAYKVAGDKHRGILPKGRCNGVGLASQWISFNAYPSILSSHVPPHAHLYSYIWLKRPWVPSNKMLRRGTSCSSSNLNNHTHAVYQDSITPHSTVIMYAHLHVIVSLLLTY